MAQAGSEALRSGFSQGLVGDVCDLQGGIPIPVGTRHVDGQNVNSVDISVNNVAQDRNNTFLLPITLWVYGKKVQTKGLVDSGATTNFISHRFIQTNHLVSNRLAHLIPVRNADGTTNSLSSIKYYVRALL